MKTKYNNRLLLGILIGLAAIYFLTDLLRDRKRGSGNLRTELVFINQAEIESISLFPKVEEGKEIKLSKNNGVWQVEKEGLINEADPAAVTRLLDNLQAIKPDRLVSKSEDKWKNYEVDDTLANKVIVRETGGKESLNINIGRFNYVQAPNFNPQNPSQGISGYNYVRLAEDKEVYTTNGFLSFSINQGFNAWRKADFLKANTADIKNINFTFPGDTSYVLSKQDSVWYIGTEVANETEVQSYLNQFTSRQDRNFADDFTPSGAAPYKLILSGDNINSLTIEAWPADATAQVFYLKSSLNPANYFSSAPDGLFGSLFVGAGKFK